MRRTSSGFGEKDFDKLLKGFNFECREGKHRIYNHKIYQDLAVIVPRKKEQRNYLVAKVLKIIDELIKRDGEETYKNDPK